jgi:hypothetical protein
LLGKVRKDSKVLERSRILALEEALGNEIVPAKREIVRDNISGDMEDVITAMRLIITQRLKNAYEHMDELGGLSGKNMDVIEHMMKKVKADKEFEKSLQRFRRLAAFLPADQRAVHAPEPENLDSTIAHQEGHGNEHDHGGSNLHG